MSKTWEHYGAHDPYYGVLTAPEYSAGRMTDEARARFFASGVSKVDQAILQAEEVFGPLNRGIALDYGCGAGRLTRRLADLFAAVIAVDVSHGMLQVAKENLAGRAVAFEHAASMAASPVNFILSLLVFQHVPAKEGMKILPLLVNRLNGTGIVDLPVAYTGGIGRRALRAARRWVERVVPVGPPTIPMYLYDPDRVCAVLEELGCRVRLVTFDAPMFRKANVIFHRRRT